VVFTRSPATVTFFLLPNCTKSKYPATMVRSMFQMSKPFFIRKYLIVLPGELQKFHSEPLAN
jgi:hypothetical protein